MGRAARTIPLTIMALTIMALTIMALTIMALTIMARTIPRPIPVPPMLIRLSPLSIAQVLPGQRRHQAWQPHLR